MRRLHAAACRRVVLFVLAVFPCVAGWAHAQPFTDIGAALVGVRQGSQAWGDYDNDGDLDALITGDSGCPGLPTFHFGSTKLYRNDAGVFTDTGAALEGVYKSVVAWGDYDDDGDLDIVLAGDSQSDWTARVYRNEGDGSFAHVASLTAVSGYAVGWGDYDNDGDLDIFLSGSLGGDQRKMRSVPEIVGFQDWRGAEA